MPKYSFLFLFLLLSLFISCKKEKKDETPPSVHITSPNNGASYDMYDTILVTANLNDETNLKRVEVRLLDNTGATVQNSFGVDISGSDHHFVYQLELYEYRLPSGVYTIEVSASDGSNVTVATVNVNITESPTTKKGYFLITQKSNQNFLIRCDTNFVDQNTFTTPGNYICSSLSNYYQLIMNSGIPNQNFKAIDININQIAWTINNSNSVANIISIADDGKNIFVGKNDGNAYKHNYLGSIQKTYASGEIDYYTNSVFYCNDYLVVGLNNFYNSTKRTIVFEISTGLIKKVLLNNELKAAYVKSDNELYLLSNTPSGEAILETLTILGGNVSQTKNFGTKNILSSCAINYGALLISLSDNNVYYYQASNNSYSSVLSGTAVNKLKYSSRFNEVYMLSYKDFYVYDAGNFSLSLKNNISKSDTIKDFHIWLNK